MATKVWSFKYATTDDVAIMNKVTDAPEDKENLAQCRAQALISCFPLYPAGTFDENERTSCIDKCSQFLYSRG